MNEHSIFLAALEIVDPSQRASYLDQACADDPSLRKQVEALFVAHERSGEFLDVPALKQMAAGHADATSAEHDADQGEIDLSFLEPSTVPGSLGRLQHYEVREVIGRGGCGIVLKAFDERLERIVAIKVMAPELAATSPARKRFLREARATAAIRHENVVSIYAVEEQPLPFLVMEFIEGETLQQRLDRTGPLDVPAVLRIGHQIAGGLAAAHDKGLIHRDIKPGNILLENGTDHLKITDFGLARTADDASMTQSGLIAGTPLYMSPEQAQAHDIDQRSDQFSLGSVLYIMSSGRPPFRAASTLAVIKRVVEEQPRPIQGIIPEVPQWLTAIIAKLHAKEPGDRFASARQVGDLLARCLSELEQYGRVELPEDIVNLLPQPTSEAQELNPGGNSTPAPATVSPPARWHGRRWASAAAILLVILAGLGVTEATGVTDVGGTVIRLFSPEGTLVVEVDDPGVSVTIDGEEIVITGTGAKEIRLKPGQYKLLASKNGKVVRQELVAVTNNGRQVVRVSKESHQGDGGTARTDPEARIEETAALSAKEMAEKVRQELRSRNPDFKGAITYLVEDGHVVRWSIVEGTLPDLSPLLALEHLKQLNYVAFDPGRDAPVLRQLTSLEKINGDSAASYRLAYPANKPQRGVSDDWLKAVSKLPVKSRVRVVIEKLQELNPNYDGKHWFREGDMFLRIESMAVTDLSPLKAIPELRQLVCSGLFGKRTWLADLSPLSRIPLTRLECANTRVSDLSSLKGMPLETLILAGTPVADLGPLTGMPLTKLHVNGTQVEDLRPVADAKLQFLSCDSTKIADLTPLNGMPLAELYCYGTPISDLSPLKGAPLRLLSCWKTQVSDLTPLAGMPLKELYCFGTRVSDLSPLEGMHLTHLQCGHGRVSDLSPLRGMALRQLNVRETEVADLSPLAGTALIELYCANSSISDLSPLKGLRLTHLEVNGTTVNELSPLQGMPLTFLKFNDTRVSELSPLKGMPLESLWIPEVSAEKLQIIRGIETLKQINGKPAAEFWKSKAAP